MSETSRPATGSRVELEPVTCWPLIIAAVSFVSISVVAIGLAACSALLAPATSSVVAEVGTQPETPPAPRDPAARGADLPAPPVIASQEERVVKKHREVIHQYRPMPAVAARPRQLPDVRSHLASYKPPQEVVPTFPRPPVRSEAELLRQFWAESVEVSIETNKGDGKKLVAEAAKHPTARPTKLIAELLEKRSDLRGLPLLDEKSCTLPRDAALVLGEVSLKTRRVGASLLRGRTVVREETPTYRGISPGTVGPKEMALCTCLDEITKTHGSKAILARPLEQIYQTETHMVRAYLLGKLAAIKGQEATEALARRAVFDLNPSVRSAAVEALQKRPLAEARPIFLAALQHPWAPAAEHAASALVALNDQDATDNLEKLASKPDPSRPFKKGEKWYVRELVRVNHLGNCLLCHPPSQDRRDIVTAPIPVPGEPLPVVYYSGRGKGGAVRAEVVYFRQDFSAMHEVARPEKWPALQRFDYLVRKRELSGPEPDRTRAGVKDKRARRTDYRQHDAVCYALDVLRAARAKTAKQKTP
jgi:hypothetical protein